MPRARDRAVVAEGATNRAAGVRAWLSDVFGWRGPLQEGLERLLYGTADLLTAADPPIALRGAVAAASPRPVLPIAGGAFADEGSAGRYIQARSPSSAELWIVPETGHTAALRVHPEQWERRVTALLADALAIQGSEVSS